MYKINFGVWENDEGWQPHDIKSRTAESLEEAEEIATKMTVICTERVICTITDDSGKKIKEIGW